MSHGIGSLRWELKRGGRLSRLDRLTLVAQAMQFRLWRHLRQMGRGAERDARRLAAVDVHRIRIPDSRIAVLALEHVTAVSPDWLLKHCLRTYLFGAILGLKDGIRYDEELLYVASLLHDLGLTPGAQADPAACFAVAGARQAEALAAGWGWPKTRREQMREAIDLHLNPSVPVKHGAEAHLLHEGAGCDVVGARKREIAPAALEQVLTRHPRSGFATQMASTLREEAQRRPHGRLALFEQFGFSRLIEQGW